MLRRTPLKKQSEKNKLSKKEATERTYRLHKWLLSLWKKLPKVKECTSCGKRIWGDFLTLYFDHLLPKKKYPQFEFEEKNIYFCCADCHTKKENGFPTDKHKEAIEKAKLELLTDK